MSATKVIVPVGVDLVSAENGDISDSRGQVQREQDMAISRLPCRPTFFQSRGLAAVHIQFALHFGRAKAFRAASPCEQSAHGQHGAAGGGVASG